MSLSRCENGHFYDLARFVEGCPYCNQNVVSTVGIGEESGKKIYTQPLEPTPGWTELQKKIEDAKEKEGQVTVGYYGTLGMEPVVGWLVAVAGNHFGEDFKLKTGRNFIGRSTEMDVKLTGDSSVSRDRHAVIVYEPRGNVFLVQPGDAKELFYINERVVLAATKIAAYDILNLGETKLMFIPCCSEKFNWDSVKPEEGK